MASMSIAWIARKILDGIMRTRFIKRTTLPVTTTMRIVTKGTLKTEPVCNLVK